MSEITRDQIASEVEAWAHFEVRPGGRHEQLLARVLRVIREGASEHDMAAFASRGQEPDRMRKISTEPCGVDACDRPQRTRGLCATHYARLIRHGDVNATKKRPTGGLRAEIDAAASDASDGPCLLLTGHQHRPTIHLSGVSMTASRAVWVLANGDPRDLHVLHTCGMGREGCIRLSHLYLGTNSDNGRDASRDGAMARGTRHYQARLTELDVLEIRRLRGLGQSRSAVATAFAVSVRTVRDIEQHRSWAWLEVAS